MKKMLLVLMLVISFGVVGTANASADITPFCLRPICIGDK